MRPDIRAPVRTQAGREAADARGQAAREVAGPPLPPGGWPGARLPGIGMTLEPGQPPRQAHDWEGHPLPLQTPDTSGQPPMPGP